MSCHREVVMGLVCGEVHDRGKSKLSHLDFRLGMMVTELSAQRIKADMELRQLRLSRV
jgi:hypothetical protein